MGIYLRLNRSMNGFYKKESFRMVQSFMQRNIVLIFLLLTPEHDPKPSLLSGYDRKLGNDEDDLDLEVLIYKINTMPRDEFGEEITKYWMFKKYLLWLCGMICTQNYDGFIHNYALYRNEED